MRAVYICTCRRHAGFVQQSTGTAAEMMPVSVTATDPCQSGPKRQFGSTMVRSQSFIQICEPRRVPSREHATTLLNSRAGDVQHLSIQGAVTPGSHVSHKQDIRCRLQATTSTTTTTTQGSVPRKQLLAPAKSRNTARRSQSRGPLDDHAMAQDQLIIYQSHASITPT